MPLIQWHCCGATTGRIAKDCPNGCGARGRFLFGWFVFLMVISVVAVVVSLFGD